MAEQSCHINELHALLSDCLRANVPFYAFRKPDSKRIEVGVQTEGELLSYQCFSNLKGKTGFVFSPFDRDGKHKSWFIRKDIALTDHEIPTELTALLKAVKPKQIESPDILRPHESSYQEYLEQINRMIEDLKQKKLDKVILSRIQLLNDGGRHKAVGSFLKLTETYQSAFVFFVAIPSVGIWIGASPEALVSANNNNIETVALAGTQKLANRQVQNVVWEDKEIVEQAYVSDYIEELLSQHQVNSFKKDGPNTVRAGNVVHLKTSFQFPFNLNFDQLSNFIEDLHPTPAVCGLPKNKAMELIKRVEQHDREYYAGYLGPVEADGATSLYVNLRSMKVLEHQMALFMGGGITADSSPEKEWEETCLKAQTLLNVISK